MIQQPLVGQAPKIKTFSKERSHNVFILFDIDVVFLIPWVLTHRDLVAAGIPILGPMLFFTFILVAGLIYELKSGALEWEK